MLEISSSYIQIKQSKSEITIESSNWKSSNRYRIKAISIRKSSRINQIKTMNINIFKRSNAPIIHATIVPWSPLI